MVPAEMIVNYFNFSCYESSEAKLVNIAYQEILG